MPGIHIHIKSERLFTSPGICTQAGQVESVQIITDRDTGRSKGFAFVEMSNDEAATKAIAEFNGKEVNGRNLTVNEARPKEKRDFGGPRGGRGGYGRY